MAHAALISLSQTLLNQFTGVDQHQIKSLRENSCFLLAFLEEHHANSGERDDPLERQIREAAYRAEDIIEIHILNIVSENGQIQDREKRCYEDLQRVIDEIDSIVEEAKKRQRSRRIEDPALTSRALGLGLSRQAPSCGNDTVGLDDVLLKLKSRVCGGSNQRRVISIVGMGGIGKTTLAKAIFDDSYIAYYFDFRAWVTISQEYCVREILLSLLTSLSAMTDDLSNASDDILVQRVYQSLTGRRYLVIMDDMWSIKAWDKVGRVLPKDDNGSRIIITSRLSEVAVHADSSCPPQEVELLDLDQSWSLLQKKVFAEEPCPSELEKIGKTIAGRCGGLPLAIVLVAGLLSDVTTISHWKKVEENLSSTLARSDDHLYKMLSLSYNNLPHHLRACFLYMGGFPEDSEILVSRLTKLWVAEGFLKPVGSKSLEEVAEDYVEDLVKRNLISITKRSSNGRFRFCRVHDILRDFCRRIAQNENFLHVTDCGNVSQEGNKSKRRLCSITSVPLYLKKPRVSPIRSILLFNKRYSLHFPIFYRLLRVFSGTNVCLDLLNPALTELFHLRYLSFSYASLDFVVPASISELRNLQTLVIQFHELGGGWLKIYERNHSNSTRLCLPSEIWKMPKLRHIILDNYFFLPVHFDRENGGKTCVLENLQTLSRVANFSFATEIIQMIPNLKKLAVVYNIDGLKDPREYYVYNLDQLHQLENLNLRVDISSYLRHRLMNPLLHNFTLPQCLKKLTLYGCGFSWERLSIVGQLPSLEVLKLKNNSFTGEEWKSVEGEFLQLKLLLMCALDVKCWLTEHTHFPCLERLIVIACEKLEGIPSEIGDIPTLKSIEVFIGTESATDSAIRIQEEQRSNGNDSLRVHVQNQLPISWIERRVSPI